MAEEPDNLVLKLPREMRADMKSEFAGPDETVRDVRNHVASLDLRVEALDEKFETVPERAPVDLRKQMADRAWGIEKLEGAR